MTLTDRRFSRRALIRGSIVGAAGITTILVLGCEDDGGGAGSTPSAGQTTTASGETPTAEATEFALVSGWYRGQQVKYYDFGMNSQTNGSSVAAVPIFAFITGMAADGSPQFVEGQHNIVDLAPGDTGYSDLWQVNLVTVPGGYQSDSVRSKADLDAQAFEVTPTDMLVNCPIVPAGSTLEGGEELVQGWYKGEEVFYPDFGANPTSALPIWVFITGMNADGSPRFVEGQNNVIDAVPSDAGYSAFWRVNLVTVPEGYEPNSITSARDVLQSGYAITETDMVVNCPVTVF